MSLTIAVWVVLAVSLTLLSVKRSTAAIALYMLTFFAAPNLWWWGDRLPDVRYAYWAGILLLGAVLLHASGAGKDAGRRFTIVHGAGIAMVINATFVNFALAADPIISTESWIEFAKFVLLFFLIWAGIQNRKDYRFVVLAIALGAAYIGYEITINERGDFRGSRLEGVGAPGADTSNGLACLMLIVLPLIGSLFVNGSKRDKLIVILAGPLVLNVILLCNSRGAFLGLIGAALSFLLVARGRTRKLAFKSLALGGLALFLLLGDPQILDRFTSTFVGSEDRDNSAASRVEFWKAGLLMLSDYPLGAGGNSFKSVFGGEYLGRVISADADDRSLHNGYLTEATDWGVQGLALKLLFFGGALLAAYRTSMRALREQRINDALMGISVIAAMGGFLIHSAFGSFFSNEWAYWVVALLVRYSEVYSAPEVAAGTMTDAPILRRVAAA